MIDRRAAIWGMAGWALTTSASAHTLYPQWVAYRKKHLLIGCHRKDLETWRQAERLVGDINHALPKAKARAARAPHPQRLASLIGTDQLELAVLGRAEALEMRDGSGKFAPYGKLSLTQISGLGAHVLVAEQSFPKRHGWMLASALATLGGGAPVSLTGELPPHPGALAYQNGAALDDLEP